jgi:hypothetical protein
MLLLLIHSSYELVEVRLSSEPDFQQTYQTVSYILGVPLLTLLLETWKVRLAPTHNQRAGQRIGVGK